MTVGGVASERLVLDHFAGGSPIGQHYIDVGLDLEPTLYFDWDYQLQGSYLRPNPFEEDNVESG